MSDAVSCKFIVSFSGFVLTASSLFELAFTLQTGVWHARSERLLHQFVTFFSTGQKLL